MSQTITAETIAERAAEYVRTLNAWAPQGESFELVPNPRGRYSRIVKNGGSVHAFIELSTGLVFKAAGWKAPAKGARYDLASDPSFTNLLVQAAHPHAFAGGYLYAR